MGYRFRLHAKDLPGKPDIVLPRYGKIILVHGCFWHQHSRCRDGRVPNSNRDYWVNKLAGNTARDARHQTELRRLGWQLLVIWECELADIDRLSAKLSKFMSKERR
jgi:DNA mismatch endonuclease (patch repair protein)